MKRHILFVVWSLVVFALAAGAMTGMYWTKRTIWPEFPQPQASDPQPQVVVQVEPDFAWRIGDRIPVHIFIKHDARVKLDANSLAVEGDFEIAQLELFERDKKDGTHLVHITANFQSFKSAPKVGFKALMSYRVAGSRDSKTLTIQAPDIYTSKTWDGRPDIKDGPLPVVHGWHYWTTALALVGGLFGLIWALLFLRKIRATADQEPDAAQLTRWQLARQEFDEVWRLIALGDEDPLHYKEIERIIRRTYHIESRTVREIPWELGQGHPHVQPIVIIFGLCDRVVYGHRQLSAEEKAKLKKTFDGMIPPPKPATVTGVKAKARR